MFSCFIKVFLWFTVADPGFRRRGSNPKDGGTSLLFGKMLLRIAWKRNKSDREGAHILSPLRPLGSVNGLYVWITVIYIWISKRKFEQSKTHITRKAFSMMRTACLHTIHSSEDTTRCCLRGEGAVKWGPMNKSEQMSSDCKMSLVGGLDWS